MNITAILPEISLFISAIVILMSDVFLSKKVKEFFYASHLLSMIACFISLSLLFHNFPNIGLSFHDMFLNSFSTHLLKAVILLLLTIVILFSLNFLSSIKEISAEFLALLMIASCGAMLLISANDFLTFYLALELQALSLYLLAALNKNSAKSSEAGMKYFVLGAAASGILLFGISLIYGFSGTTNFTALSALYTEGQSVIPLSVMLGFILVLTAMFFKISAAPFHMWAPDVYEGSPTIVTTFFATVVKFSVVIVLVRLFSGLLIGWAGIEKIFIFVAIISLAVGSFGAIKQKNIKRLLAYSGIGHMGFVLLALAVRNKNAVEACVLYMIIYAILSLGSFGFLNLIRSSNEEAESDANNERIFDISAFSGLSKTNPIMAFSIAVLMFSTAGIPPFAGFFSKFYVIMSALSGGFLISSIIAILFSVVSAYYYLRIIKIMYFDEPNSIIKIDDIWNIKIVIFVIAIFNLAFLAFLDPILMVISNFSS